MKKGITKFGDYEVLVDPNYHPLNNYEWFKKGTKIRYDAENNMMSNVEYNVESEEISS